MYLIYRTPVKNKLKRPKIQTPSKSPTKEDMKTRAIKAIKLSHYRAVFNTLLESKAAQTALAGVLVKTIRKEVSEFLKVVKGLGRQDCDTIHLEDIESFDVDGILNTLKEKAFITHNCIRALMEKGRRKQM